MNIFEYNDMMKMQQQQQPAPQQMYSGNNIPGLMMNYPQGGLDSPTPQMRGDQGDPSGFANYGMESPQLPNPMQEIGGLMKMAALGNRIEDPFARAPQGGLMAYLQSLAGV